MPYGMTETRAYCINSEPGTFNHECQKPATGIGAKSSGFAACFCNDCKQNGYEAAGIKDWQAIN